MLYVPQHFEYKNTALFVSVLDDETFSAVWNDDCYRVGMHTLMMIGREVGMMRGDMAYFITHIF
jgi:hypothetical protein